MRREFLSGGGAGLLGLIFGDVVVSSFMPACPAEDHDNIQPLCKLLESVGKPLEAASKEKMDDYFARIQELAGQTGLSSRYKFMLLDLKDLRTKDWVPR